MGIIDSLGRWDTATAYEMARRSQAEYFDDVEPVIRGICPDTVHVEPWRGSHIEFSVSTCPGFQVVTFRGTEPRSLVDWVTDARALPRRWELPGHVHGGFADAYLGIEAGCLRWLARDRPVLVTGHSLGAALATLCAARLAVHPEITVGALYTFGSPRVFDRTAATWLESKLPGRAWRVVNNNDIVTRLPVSIGGYWHVGALTYLDTDGRIVHDPSRWDLFRSRVRGRIEALMGGEPTIDEVPGLDAAVLAALNAAGIRTLRQAALAEVARVVAIPGVGPAAYEAIKRWIDQRLAGAEPASAVFDGTRDHFIARYVTHLRGAAIADGARDVLP